VTPTYVPPVTPTYVPPVTPTYVPPVTPTYVPPVTPTYVPPATPTYVPPATEYPPATGYPPATEYPPATDYPAGDGDISDAQLYGGYDPTAPATVAPSPTPYQPTPYQPPPVTPTYVPPTYAPPPPTMPATPFALSEVMVCENVIEGRPVGGATAFGDVTTKVHCWYRFSNETGIPVNVVTDWFYFFAGKNSFQSILKTPRDLPVGSGAAFSVVSRGGGQPLPKGHYRVELKVGDKLVGQVSFTIGR